MMQISFGNGRLFALLCLAVLAMAPHSLGSGKYRRFPETISSDGAYVLAWGARDHPGSSLRGMKDISANQERVFNMETPNDQPPSFDNYLVDAVNGRVLAILPNSHNTGGPEGSQNHFSLDVAWSPASKAGVAIYDFRWGSAAVDWMEPRSRSAIDIGGQLYAAVRRLLIEKKRWRKSFVVNFSNPAVSEQHTLIVNALVWTPKGSADDLNYRMRFHISSVGGKASVKLEKFRSVRESDEAFIYRGMESAESADAELNEVYAQLRAKLDRAGHEALKSEEKKWLSVREGTADPVAFTLRRIAELRARAEDW